MFYFDPAADAFARRQGGDVSPRVSLVMMLSMSAAAPFHFDFPEAATPALIIVRKLSAAGHQALLAGGCARDLLLGLAPQDYDVATDATPEQICRLIRKTRKVGVQFGVVLARERRRWVEVATFRSDGEYFDGRRPCEVHFCDARHDAERRDFTVNGMFLDPTRRELIDYVGGRADLDAKLIRAIGDPSARFAEDHLRLIRAVRFAARLEFKIEPATFEAVKAHASKLATVAAERVREELEKILTDPRRRRGLDLLDRCGLLPNLWKGGGLLGERPAGDRSRMGEQVASASERFGMSSDRVSFPLALAWLLAERAVPDVHDICRVLTCSNEHRETAAWLIAHRCDLDDPSAISLADLKRLLAHSAFGDLRIWALGRYRQLSDGDLRARSLDERIDAIRPEDIQPPPLATGDDLAARGAAPGPIYRIVLDELYTLQLNDVLTTREEALAALDDLLLRMRREGD